MPWNVAGSIRGPIGPPGLQGDPGPVGPDGLMWRGQWDTGTAYVADDAVGYGGASYFAVTGSTGETPDAPGSTFWALLAAQGAPGLQGNPGAPGEPGSPGSPGAPGPRGTNWYLGTGAPGAIAGSLPGDLYLDTVDGTVYALSA